MALASFVHIRPYFDAESCRPCIEIDLAGLNELRLSAIERFRCVLYLRIHEELITNNTDRWCLDQF